MTRLKFPLSILGLTVSLAWPSVAFNVLLGVLIFEKVTVPPSPPQVTIPAPPPPPLSEVCWVMPNGGTGEPITVCWEPTP